jgi:hypothetical protein
VLSGRQKAGGIKRAAKKNKKTMRRTISPRVPQTKTRLWSLAHGKQGTTTMQHMPTAKNEQLNTNLFNDFLCLLQGKIRRQVLVNTQPEKVKECHQLRHGECRQCAACCKLIFRCPFLSSDNRCSIHESPVRPRSCQVFPIARQDLEDVRRSSGNICGFWFASDKN